MTGPTPPSPYPLGLRLGGRRVVVVGGGAVATRRVPALLDAGADVLLVSPELTPALRAHVDAGRLHWEPRRFAPGDLDGAWLVQVAVDDRAAAAAVSAAAAERRIFCVRADDRTAASAWTPAVTRHGPVTVAVLGGGDPRRAMGVRDAVRDLLGARTAPGFAPSPEAGGAAGGRVALVGAGPGDPELITVKGWRLLTEAEVVVADRLVPGLLLDELRPDVELVDASKIPYGPSRAQEEINRILVDRARAGKVVVRLKGGDPYVFGRGGEELLACAEAGVPVTVVPGVTSAIAVPEVAGVPVTHRGVAHEFTVVSGHLAPDAPASLVRWDALAGLRGTLVILMGLKNLAAISATLIAHGKPAETPAAVIQEGTTAAQRTLRSTLGTVAADVEAAALRPPAIVVVGDVVHTLTPTP
ncbi:uroporphyrinogen-III C-methyltransferase [Micromonospora tulbaghiae]|uniref:Uroporphyrinogen-III C-methyltransferase n=1 Tax=Micromonospora tulbaghiae TaxID=479978 RepID=A0AAW4JDZ4_9ACTN|nr:MULTISPECIES: uroporphyrinogen-III C-methyltransferase [Micromonospora]KAB1901517.1 uroporphyrinogen-III C-methyltransferase [Micromonospora sp. AMSO1212t]MBO4139595.1 uroporphyrinogen-III C-methyltransferase [Micromonospora tulbaghiae]MDX5457384.1 uroporphyrinogen-III C-methyltransferase [Micromonospora tulbaghiae]SCE95858.1 uroporphyrinogen-III C-methyltransferase [Micromonospora tulbaghiae]